MDKEKTITLYGIAKILDEQKDECERTFNLKEFARDVRKKFKAILQVFGVEIDIFSVEGKKGYRFPSSQVDNIIEIMKTFNSAAYKPIKKGNGNFAGVQLEELQKIMGMLEELINASFNDKEADEHRSRMYLKTRSLFLQESKEIMDSSVEDIKVNIEELRPNINEFSVGDENKNEKDYYLNNHFLNDMDRIRLIGYYNELIEEATNKWKRIVKIVSEERVEELSSDEATTDAAYYENEFTPIDELLVYANAKYNEERNQRPWKTPKKVSKEEYIKMVRNKRK